MPRQIPHVTSAGTDIIDVAIPTPQPADVAPSLNQVNAITGPIIAALVNDLALARAYVDALLASHAAKDRQIAALRAALKVGDAADDVPPVPAQDAVAADQEVAARGGQVDEARAGQAERLAAVPEPSEAVQPALAETGRAPFGTPPPKKAAQGGSQHAESVAANGRAGH